jgi:SP family general alpha glucoside:H+ symporter-like MFS transporter
MAADLEKTEHTQQVEHDVEKTGEPPAYAEKPSVADYKADAILAENEEHNMTVMQAVKAYPMASFWAFVMSCTIVSCQFLCAATPHS